MTQVSSSDAIYIGSACVRLINNLHDDIGCEVLESIKILITQKLYTPENCKAIFKNKFLLNQIIYLNKHTQSQLPTQACLDLLIYSAEGPELEDYINIRTEHITCVLVELWKYQLLDNEKYRFLSSKIQENVEANMGLIWKDYPLCLMPENPIPLEKGKLYFRVLPDRYHSSYLTLEFHVKDLNQKHISFEDNFILANTASALEFSPDKLLWIKNKALANKLHVEGRNWAVTLTIELLNRDCKIQIPTDTLYCFDRDLNRFYSMDSLHSRYGILYLKAFQLMESAGILDEENKEIIFKNCSAPLVSILICYLDTKLLNDNNFKIVCSLDFTLIVSLESIISSLNMHKLLSQEFLNAILGNSPLAPILPSFSKDFRYSNPFLTEVFINKLLKLINIVPLTPELLVKILQFNKIDNVNKTFEILSKVNFLTTKLSEKLLEKIVLEASTGIFFAEVLENLQRTKFLNIDSFTMLMGLNQKDYGKMFSCITSLDKKSLLTMENLFDVFHSNNQQDDSFSEGLIAAYDVLNKNKLLAKYRNIVLTSHGGHPLSLAHTLILLTNSELLNKKNLDSVTNPYSPKYETTLLALKNMGLLNKENFQRIFTDSGPRILMREARLALMDSIGELSNIPFRQTALNILILSQNPQAAVQALVNIAHGNLLFSQENLVVLEKSPHKDKICSVINAIAALNYELNQNEFNDIVTYGFMLANNNELLSRIPAHLFTSEMLRNLIMRCITYQTDPDRSTRLSEYIDRLIGPVVQRTEASTKVILNTTQSTHTASIHTSVSESAIILHKNYGDMLAKKSNIFKEIESYINSLPGENYDLDNKNSAAKRAIANIQHKENFWEFIDPHSQLTIYNVLILSWLAIHDDSKRQGSLDNAKERFVKSLYEIQRGYNLDENGEKDDGRADRMICTGGAFNKIIEGLNTIHLDVELKFITKAGATLKLTSSGMVTDNIIKNLEIEKLSTEALQDLKQSIIIDGLDSFIILSSWKAVQPAIYDGMSEYKSVFKGEEEYTDFINSGLWAIELDKIEKLIDERLASAKQNQEDSIKLSSSTFFKPGIAHTKDKELPLEMIVLFCIPIIGQIGYLIYLLLDELFPWDEETSSKVNASNQDDFSH